MPVANAGGAAGPVGPGTGLGEAVSLVDYDVDGFVDMLVHNGLAQFPAWNERGNGGPDKLYNNDGEIDGTNNWVEIDLVGVTSNRDAIGARVIATAGGVSQLREQGGNYKRWTQSHQRLHFGLGSNATVNLQVSWPNGTSRFSMTSPPTGCTGSRKTTLRSSRLCCRLSLLRHVAPPPDCLSTIRRTPTASSWARTV